jgi:SulP family sulfate permease
MIEIAYIKSQRQVKDPVMDKLEKTDFIAQLKPGKVFFCNADAVKELAG